MGKLVLTIILMLYTCSHGIEGKIDVDFLSSPADQQLITDSKKDDEFLPHIGEDDDGLEGFSEGYGAAPEQLDTGLMTVHTLKEWIQLDYQVYINLTNAIEGLVADKGGQLETLDPSIQEYLADYEELSESLSEITNIRKGDSRVKAISWNLLAIYRLVRRLYLYLPGIFENLEPKFQDTIRGIKEAYFSIGGPTEKDYEDSMLAIVNVHFLHDLKASDIAAGYVKERDLGVILNPYHSYEIGSEAIAKHFFTTGIEWLEHALGALPKEGSLLDPEVVQDLLEDSVQYHDEEFVNSQDHEPNFFTQPLRLERDPEKRQTRKQSRYEEFKTNLEPEYSDLNYMGVCSGKPHQTEAAKSKLFCWYESKAHPWWRIGPLKAEFLSLTPVEVVQYYEVISDRAAEALKMAAVSKFEKSPSFFEDGSSENNVNSMLRFSSHTWLNGSSKEEASMTNIVESITGWAAVGGGGGRNDELQVAAYSPGGHYVSHLDAIPYGDGQKAHRLATFLIYLSDVPHGGETAFAQAGARATPIKGSAIFWYNMYSDGETNQLTYHGGCPVLYGEKWVATRLILYEQPKSNLQCHLQPKSPVNILVNGKAWRRRT